MQNGKQLSVKLDPREAVFLEKLARESGRSQGQVLQRLIVFAMNNDDALKMLGIVREKAVTHDNR